MSSEEDRAKHSSRRKRNFVKRDMFSNELKGAFAIKTVDARKPEYHREKLRVTDIIEGHEDEANY